MKIGKAYQSSHMVRGHPEISPTFSSIFKPTFPLLNLNFFSKKYYVINFLDF